MIQYREAEELSDSWVEYLDKLEDLGDLAGTIITKADTLRLSLEYYGMPDDAQNVEDIMDLVNVVSSQIRATREVARSIGGQDILDIYEEVAARDEAAQERG